jgi:hypothetical protein
MVVAACRRQVEIPDEKLKSAVDTMESAKRWTGPTAGALCRALHSSRARRIRKGLRRSLGNRRF